MEHANYWQRPEEDPFGFGAAVEKQIAEGTIEPLMINDVLPEDADLPPYEA